AELVKTPDHLHTYRITPLSLWNAVSAGWTVQEAVGFLEEESKFGLPASLKRQVEEKMGRCGLVTLTSKEKQLILSVADAALSQKMRKSRPWRDRMTFLGRGTFAVPSELRGWVKQELIRLGYPVEDRAGYTRGEPLSLQLKETTHL